MEVYVNYSYSTGGHECFCACACTCVCVQVYACVWLCVYRDREIFAWDH